MTKYIFTLPSGSSRYPSISVAAAVPKCPTCPWSFRPVKVLAIFQNLEEQIHFTVVKGISGTFRDHLQNIYQISHLLGYHFQSIEKINNLVPETTNIIHRYSVESNSAYILGRHLLGEELHTYVYVLGNSIATVTWCVQILRSWAVLARMGRSWLCRPPEKWPCTSAPPPPASSSTPSTCSQKLRPHWPGESHRGWIALSWMCALCHLQDRNACLKDSIGWWKNNIGVGGASPLRMWYSRNDGYS